MEVIWPLSGIRGEKGGSGKQCLALAQLGPHTVGGSLDFPLQVGPPPKPFHLAEKKTPAPA